jgi:hypothetical protein
MRETFTVYLSVYVKVIFRPFLTTSSSILFIPLRAVKAFRAVSGLES